MNRLLDCFLEVRFKVFANFGFNFFDLYVCIHWFVPQDRCGAGG
jgi:hypothetical protein